MSLKKTYCSITDSSNLPSTNQYFLLKLSIYYYRYYRIQNLDAHHQSVFERDKTFSSSHVQVESKPRVDWVSHNWIGQYFISTSRITYISKTDDQQAGLLRSRKYTNNRG